MSNIARDCKKPLVVYWNNMPAPYMVDRFNALAARNNLSFEAWFNERKGAGRSWAVDESSWQFKYRYVRGLRFGMRRLLIPPILYTKRCPDVIVSLYAEPVFLLGWIVARLRGALTMFRVLKTFDRWVPRRRWKERLKKFLYSRVDGIETPGPDGRDYAIKYGSPKQKIHILPHAFDIDAFVSMSDDARARRKDIRRELGVKGVTYVYVGRLWRGKGLRDLIEAFSIVRQSVNIEVTLLLVGDGPDEEFLKSICESKKLTGVVFAGFRPKTELPAIYASSDAFVFPTLGDPYGLVVDEAMACLLPVVSSDAAGEIRERVVTGVNGFVVPCRDIRAMAVAMSRLANDEHMRASMGEESRRRVRMNNPNSWAIAFEKAIWTVLDQ